MIGVTEILRINPVSVVISKLFLYVTVKVHGTHETELILKTLFRFQMAGYSKGFQMTLIMAYFHFKWIVQVMFIWWLKSKGVMFLFIWFPIYLSHIYFQTVIDVPSKVLDRLFWEDVESQPSWNPSVRESQVIPTTAISFSLFFLMLFSLSHWLCVR